MPSVDDKFQKPCYRCDKLVRMTEAEYHAAANCALGVSDSTICPECSVKLEVEFGYAGTPSQASVRSA